MTVKLATRQAARLKGHTGPINALTYSSGAGQYILSGSSDRTINLWSPAKAIANAAADGDVDPSSPSSSSKALVQSYTGAHGYEVLSLAVSGDNARFASGGGDKTVFLWDVSAARTLRRFGGGAAGGHGGKVECVALGGDGDAVVVSGSFDATVRLWDAKAQGNRPMMVLGEARDSVTSLCVRGSEVWAGSVDGRIRGYDLRMGVCHVDVVGPPVTSLTATTQADSVLVSTLDSTLRLMDTSNGKLLQDYKHSDYVNTTYRIRSTLAANDSIAISGSEDGWIYAWDVLSGELATKVKHDVGANSGNARSGRKVVSALACKKKAEEWASAAGDGTIVIWKSPS